MLGLAILVLLAVIAIAAPVIAPYNSRDGILADRLAPPSRDHLFGADALGRDIFSRVVYGARISFLSAIATVVGSAIIGTLIGLFAGFYGKWTDEILMRVTDAFFAFPSLVLAMAIAAMLGPSLRNALLAVAFVQWPIYARLIRGQVLGIRNLEYVEAASALGAGNGRLLFRHILPNAFQPVMVQATLDMGVVLLITSGLSFIGFGAQEPTPEWGLLVSAGRQYIMDQWWVSGFPGLAIFLMVMGFNLFGDGLRDLLDPRLRK